ncbi:hypothetical protein E2562_003754 [Oryza meyeriana var. granulata]|uniref:Uncharacterized protein n=1 Tax=Oryza meyeriana var. granulata TaxID=110450 RepID=A0A6G1BRC7_9ORYZ|nr:hypothetical protein E2562_003754 [Oryza meyeriana var. granulata]
MGRVEDGHTDGWACACMVCCWDDRWAWRRGTKRWARVWAQGGERDRARRSDDWREGVDTRRASGHGRVVSWIFVGKNKKGKPSW